MKLDEKRIERIIPNNTNVRLRVRVLDEKRIESPLALGASSEVAFGMAR